MAIYHYKLYVAVTNIYVYNLNTLEVVKEYEVGANSEVLYILLYAEKLLVSTYNQFSCISLLMTEANPEHLASLITMQSYRDYLTANYQELAKYKDSRGNTFLMYATAFATDDQIDLLFTDYTVFNFCEPNQYGLSPFVLVLIVCCRFILALI